MNIALPNNLGYGRLDTLLKVFFEVKKSKKKNPICLNWTNVQKISPAGYGIIACLFDYAVERGVKIDNVFLKKDLKTIPVIKNISEISQYKRLPKPIIHNFESKELILQGQENALNTAFIQRFEEKYESLLGEDLTYSCQLILNELMQNSLDHSASERYYIYGGIWQTVKKKEIHIGVLDMGVTIPAKLEQKYIEPSDQDYLDLAVREGSTTRRSRPGGLGLFHTFEHLKNCEGTLTIVSRNAQLVRYFKNKAVRRRKLYLSLNLTWCLARFLVLEDK